MIDKNKSDTIDYDGGALESTMALLKRISQAKAYHDKGELAFMD